MARLYRKPDQCDEAHPFRTRGELALEMMKTLAEWLPGREFELLVDGAYPSGDLLKNLPENVNVVSRIRRGTGEFCGAWSIWSQKCSLVSFSGLSPWYRR